MQNNSYFRLKNALAHRFGKTIPSELAMQKFNSRFLQNRESIRAYVWSLQIENAMPDPYHDTTVYMLANQFIVGLGKRKCSEFLQLRVDLSRDDAWKTLIEQAEMFEFMQNYVPHVTRIVNHVAFMPMHVCQSEEVYFANEDSLGAVCDKDITDISCIEPEIPCIIETIENMFVAAEASIVESFEI